jgi:hypothetical protein
MLARLGQVLYWGASGFAALVGLAGVALLVLPKADHFVGGLALGFAALIWLSGRAVLYVLAAR